MNKFAIIMVSVIVLCSIITPSYAASQKLIVSAGDVESLRFYLNDGDRMRYSIVVDGGRNDDVNITIKNPNGGIMNNGRVVESFSDEFKATTSGTYYFEFDNKMSLVSSKQIQFNYDIIKPPVVSSPTVSNIASGMQIGWILLLIIIVVIVVVPIAIWKKRKPNSDDVDDSDDYDESDDDSDDDSDEDDVTERIADEQNKYSLKILKERLAKGEITKEEYDQLKKEFE